MSAESQAAELEYLAKMQIAYSKIGVIIQTSLVLPVNLINTNVRRTNLSDLDITYITLVALNLHI